MSLAVLVYFLIMGALVCALYLWKIAQRLSDKQKKKRGR